MIKGTFSLDGSYIIQVGRDIMSTGCSNTLCHLHLYTFPALQVANMHTKFDLNELGILG